VPNANKNKGKSFERQLAKHLTSVFGLNFVRVQNSGSFVGGKNSFRLEKLTNSQQLATTGDLMVPEELGHLTFECKFYKDFSFASLLSENKQLDGWIKQAKNANKVWFLVVKVNHTEPFIVYNSFTTKIYPISFLSNTNFAYYKGETVTNLKGFFEANKEHLLNKELFADIISSNESKTQFSAVLPLSGN